MSNKPSRGALMLAMLKDTNEKTVKDYDTNIVNISIDKYAIQHINCSKVIL